MTTKRKAYVRPVPSTWWKNLPFYRFYMLREGTAVPEKSGLKGWSLPEKPAPRRAVRTHSPIC